MQNKTNLRRTLITARYAIQTDMRMQWDAAICTQIVKWWHAHPHSIKTIGVYAPIKGEPDLHAAYADLVALDVRLALPVVVMPDMPLRYIAWTPGEPLATDTLGVLIPASLDAIVYPDALLVPCLGFNDGRIRLGYGGGFYDRTLAILPAPFSIGIAYSCAQVAFDAEAHDIPLDLILTEVTSM